jgi:hypothetical protein
MSDEAPIVRMPSDDPPTFSDEPHTCLFICGHWDYAIGIGPNDGNLPMHWVTLRTSGGHDDFAVFLIAALFHHLRGNADQARSCAKNASECDRYQIERAAELRTRRLSEGHRTSNFEDQYVREHAGSVTRETWEAIGRQRGWIVPDGSPA